MLYEGVYTALVTPFSGGRVDLDRWSALCERQLSAGIDGLVPCGTTGETPTLTVGECDDLVRLAVDAAADEADRRGRAVPVIAGAGSNSTALAVESVARVQALGADAALVVFPYYNKPNPRGHLLHVQACAAVGLPLVLYHVPGRTGQRLTVDLLAQLCAVPGVVGIKEATGDVAFGIDLLERLDLQARAGGSEIALLSGDDFTFAALGAMGAQGVISVLSNVAPQMTVQLDRAARSGDVAALRALTARLQPLIRYLFADSNPVPCKAAMAAQGLLDNELRLPLAPGQAPPDGLLDGLC
jgi:4-hydroxy-tetrahydrodipicolinate synthase